MKDFYSVEAFIGPFLDLESVISLKSFFSSFGCSRFNYQFNYGSLFDYRFQFLISSTLEYLEKTNFCIFLGLNLRMESPLLNARLRKNFLKTSSNFLCLYFGLSLDYTSFPAFSIGNSLKNFKFFIEGRSFAFSNFFFDYAGVLFKSLKQDFSRYARCTVLVGSSIVSRADSNFFFDAFSFFFRQHLHILSFDFNVISNYLGRISAFEVGCFPGVNASVVKNTGYFFNSFLYFFGTDEYFNFFDNFLTYSFFSVYQGIFFGSNAFFESINLVFPVAAFSERVSTFLNIEGRLRRTSKAIIPFFYVHTDVEVLKALFFFKNTFYFFNFSIMVNFNYIMQFFHNIVDYSCFFFLNIAALTLRNFYKDKVFVPFFLSSLFLNSHNFKISNNLLIRLLNNYYNSDGYSRNSKILTICFSKIGVQNFTK